MGNGMHCFGVCVCVSMVVCFPQFLVGVPIIDKVRMTRVPTTCL